MLHLYIARHGQTQWNVEKRMQGWLDSDLTELGLYNARALGERLKDIELNQVYISPSKRTKRQQKPYWDRGGSRWLKIICSEKCHWAHGKGKNKRILKGTNQIFFMLIFIIPKLIVSRDVKRFLTLKTG